MTWWFARAMVVLTLLLGTVPVAAEPLEQAPREAGTPTYRPQYLDYRGYLAASDGVAVGLMVAAIAAENGWLALGSASTYVLGGPIIHAANGQGGRAGASIGLRLGFPVVGLLGGGLVGAAVCDEGSGGGSSDGTSDDGFGCIPSVAGGMLVGMLVGGVGAMVVDDVFLGKVELPRAQHPAHFRPTLTALGPLADPKRRMLGLTLAGTF